ncbi:MAG TPA: Plug domain-containing protein, partial [Hanamia sp.]|nr:Plug domain-containing protein [Hanamia sp.]
KGSPNYMVRVLLGDSIYTKDALSYLIAISKDNMVFASIGRGLYQVAVPEKKLPDGIVTFYLFDADFHPLSERSVYVHDNSLHVKLATDKQVYGRHEKVTMNLSITDADQQPVPSLVAISAIDSTFSDPADKCPMFPADYSNKTIDNIFLAGDECLTDKERDLVMLIRENNYETLAKNMENSAADDNDSLLYQKGVVLNENNKPAPEKIVTLISNKVFRTDTTNSEGRFRFPVDNYPDSTQFGLRITNLKGRPETDGIILDTIVFPKVKTPASMKELATLNSKMLRKYIDTYYSLNTDDKHLLPHVYLKDQKKANYDVSKRVSDNSTILTSDEINERNSVGNAVLNVGGVQLMGGFLVINKMIAIKNVDASSEPLLIVNGVQVTPSASNQTSPVLAYLNTFDPQNIDFIEILRGPEGARYGMKGGNGVILVNTLNTPRVPSGSGSSFKTFYVKGITGSVLYPITVPKQNELKPSSFIDDRPTLFWSGNYFTDKTDNTISFYTSGIPGTYKVIVSGITTHGDIINKTVSFQTK